ncbi:MAG: hypothetical protein ACREI9_08440 [Nitrospiraceae bacterium]
MAKNHAWKKFEGTCGKLIGGARFAANSGERFDVESPAAVGQCKLVKTLSLEALTALVEEATAEGVRKKKIGIVFVKVRRGAGKKSPTLVVLADSMFQEWFDLNGAGEEGSVIVEGGK